MNRLQLRTAKTSCRLARKQTRRRSTAPRQKTRTEFHSCSRSPPLRFVGAVYDRHWLLFSSAAYYSPKTPTTKTVLALPMLKHTFVRSAVLLTALSSLAWAQETPYMKPPQAILDVL